MYDKFATMDIPESSIVMPKNIVVSMEWISCCLYPKQQERTVDNCQG